MGQYVAGFLFDETAETVVLIKKEKPEWQKGKLNGVGGKIEADETPLEAMRREFLEETGVDIQDWVQYCTLGGGDWAVYFFYAHGDVEAVQTMTEEEVSFYEVDFLDQYPTIPNLQWLIPMALSMPYESTKQFTVTEV